MTSLTFVAFVVGLLFGSLVFVRLRRVQTQSFPVPICADCQKKMVSLKGTTLAFVLAGVILIVLGLAMLLAPPLAGLGGLSACVGVVMVYGGFAYYKSQSNFLRSYANGFLRFKNQKFQDAFAALNPDTVRPPRDPRLGTNW